ncbi:MAG: Nramp family divalent metal transporter [Actinomycetota bacterium]|nr:Nramp family divalent metal transporter [Actinomycetota bacterium]
MSPITGQEEAGTNVGIFFRPTEENMRRWRGWWRVTNLEQFLTFFLFTILTICVMSALASATLAGQAPFESFDFVEAEGQALGLEFGGALRLFFLVAGLLVLFSTNLAVWDMIGRISADQLKVGPLRDSRFWTESRLYATSLVLLLLFSIVVLLSGLQAPLLLLVIVSFLSGATSFVYTALIVQLNRRALPAHVRMGTARTVIMSLAVVFYGLFFVVTLIDLAGEYL